MFDFLLQRFGKKQPEPVSSANEKKSVQQAAVNEARQAAIAQAEQLPEDENDAVAFILQTAFADARFIAAQKIHSKVALEQVRLAMRNTDRRVTRLVQSRLDTLLQEEKQQEQVRACVDLAERLKNEKHLLPNQVAELDRQWEAIKKVDGANVLPYEKIREELGARLAGQAVLQRQVMDALAALKRLENEEAALAPSEREAQLASLLAVAETGVQSREWVTLPRPLLNDFEETIQRLRDNALPHAQQHEALLAREKALDEWESAEASSLKPADLREVWRSLPAIHDPERMSAMQARFDALLTKTSHDDKTEKPVSAPNLSSTEVESLFAYFLSQMKKAVEEGAVREATQQGEQIARLDFSVFEPTPEQKALLAELRAELKNLVGWARWGGQTSREELIRIVEKLPAQNHPLEDLATAVSDAREKWKALNESSGMASRSQWQQFDAACNRAYEPVLEYARSQAVVREQNMLKAESLVESVREALSGLDLQSGEREWDDTINWRELVEYQRQKQRGWQQVGQITRKERKRLNAEFEQAMQPLNALLKERAKVEMDRRRELIEEVRKLDPQDKQSSRVARLLQEKWQERARAFPLGNREDQKLWQQFRVASELIFDHRRQRNEETEKERLDNLQQKEKICEKLEAERTDAVDAILQILKEADAAWRAVGAVPKEREKTLQIRYDKAVGIHLSRMQVVRDKEKRGQIDAFIGALSLCQRLEAAIPDQLEQAESLKALWDVQPSDKWKKQLSPRFEAAFKALTENNGDYTGELKSRQPQFLEQLLKLEITASIDTPSEFASERLKIQMEVLKDSLSGNRGISQNDKLHSLCLLPVLTDTASAERLVRLVRKINGLLPA